MPNKISSNGSTDRVIERTTLNITMSSRSHSPSSFVHTTRSRGHARRGLAAALVALLAVGTVGDAAAAEVHATGKVMYLDTYYKPLAGATIRLWDADIDLDDLMNSGTTNANGSFDLTGTATDSWPGHARRPDPYVEVVLDNDHVEIRALLGMAYAAESAVFKNAAGPVEFGTLVYQDQAPTNLFARARRQYDWFRQHTGDALIPGSGGEYEIVYPTYLDLSKPYTTVKRTRWPAGYDDWDSVYNAFGHRLRHAADGSLAHYLFDAGRFFYAFSHSPQAATNKGFAFDAGWADYHATLLDPYAASQVEGWDDDPGGDTVESRVANKLYRLAAACGGFEPMWKTLKNAGYKAVHSYGDFLAEFKLRYPGCQVPPESQTLHKRPQPPSAKPPMQVSLARQRGVLRQQLDLIDQRAGQEGLRVRYQPEELARLDPASARVVDRLQSARLKHARGWDAAARSAHRSAVLSMKPASEASLADGSHEASEKAARDAFLTALVEPRLQQIAELRAQIAKEREQAGDPPLARYLAGLASKYEAQEAALRAALASRGKDGTTLPTSILPPSFKSRLAPNKG